MSTSPTDQTWRASLDTGGLTRGVPGREQARPGGNIKVTPLSLSPGAEALCPQQPWLRKSGSTESYFRANFEDLTSIPQGPTGLEAWPDVLVRLTRAPFVSIAMIRGRATGNGSELALACDMSFASREKALLSHFEVGAGVVPGGGPMARLPRVMGRGRALEVLLSADDIGAADAERLGYVNRALPDAELDNFVDALATRIASFDKWAIANTKRLVNEASLPADVEIRAGWDACMASVNRPATQERIKALLEQGLQKPGDAEDRLGFYVGQLGLKGER